MRAIQQPTAEHCDLMKEVIVVIIDDLGISEYCGTRAALEAEGIIPSALGWPQKYARAHWRDGKHEFSLWRERPPGAKGPRKDFADCDWWVLRFKHVRAPRSFPQHQIQHEARSLAKKIYYQTAKGIAELNAEAVRFSRAQEDGKFQAFLDAIPGARLPLRRRPRMVTKVIDGGGCDGRKH